MIFKQLLPFFGLVILGYFCRQKNIITMNVIGWITKAVMYVFLPAVLFRKLATTPLDVLFQPTFLGAYLIAALLVMGIGGSLGYVLFERKLSHGALFGLSGAYGNIGFLAIPLLSTLIGDWASIPLALILTLDLIVLIPFATFLMQMSERSSVEGNFTPVKALKRALINPLILSIVLGLLFSALKLPVAEQVSEILSWLGMAAGPCAMFIVGTSLYGKKTSAKPYEALYITVLKLGLYPVVVWGVMGLFGIDHNWVIVATLAAAMPCAAVLSVIAEEHKILPRQASTAVLITTVLSVFLLPYLILNLS